MLSKNKIKLIQSLGRKKQRDETGLFLVEGNKMVEEALRSDFTVETLIGTSGFLSRQPDIQQQVGEVIETDSESIQRASLLQNPQDALAVIKQPANSRPKFDPGKDLALVLDFIQDPGNLGTIFRIADWFGIRTIVCSENTVDAFNPKVVQASMGAIFRINTWYTKLPAFFEELTQAGVPVYGTFLEGDNIYSQNLSPNGLIIMGNEGNGISKEIEKFVTQKLLIPTFSTLPNKPESLNVAIATAICCSEFKRRSV